MSDKEIAFCKKCKKPYRVEDLKEWFTKEFDPEDFWCPFCLEDIGTEQKGLIDKMARQYGSELEMLCKNCGKKNKPEVSICSCGTENPGHKLWKWAQESKKNIED